MRDSEISTSKLITGVLWGWVLLLFIAAWITWAVADENDVWMMLAFTGCASSALAATSQIRCYSLRLCGMMRVNRDLADLQSANLHRLR